MAFTLQIRQKKVFGKTALDIPSLARACGLNYGSNNDFYILQEDEQIQGTAVFYNPERIGSPRRIGAWEGNLKNERESACYWALIIIRSNGILPSGREI